MITHWLIDADEGLKRNLHFEEGKPKCHNAKIGSQFSMALLRNSPSLRTKLLSSGINGTSRGGTPRGSPTSNSPSILNCKTKKRRRKELDSCATAESVQMLISNSTRGVSFTKENGDAGEGLSIV